MSHMPGHCTNMTSSKNWKYTTYCIISRGGSSHGHREHTQKIWWFGHVTFEIHEQIYKKTERQWYTLIAIICISMMVN